MLSHVGPIFSSNRAHLDASQYNISVYVYQLTSEGAASEEIDEEEEISAANHWILPAQEFQGIVFLTNINIRIFQKTRPVYYKRLSIMAAQSLLSNAIIHIVFCRTKSFSLYDGQCQSMMGSRMFADIRRKIRLKIFI